MFDMYDSTVVEPTNNKLCKCTRKQQTVLHKLIAHNISNWHQIVSTYVDLVGQEGGLKAVYSKYRTIPFMYKKKLYIQANIILCDQHTNIYFKYRLQEYAIIATHMEVMELGVDVLKLPLYKLLDIFNKIPYRLNKKQKAYYRYDGVAYKKYRIKNTFILKLFNKLPRSLITFYNQQNLSVTIQKK